MIFFLPRLPGQAFQDTHTHTRNTITDLGEFSYRAVSFNRPKRNMATMMDNDDVHER
jgi:hypothetical protein